MTEIFAGITRRNFLKILFATGASVLTVAETLRENAGMPMTPDEQIYFDEQFRSVREKMDALQFDSTWSKGLAMTMERAIELALEITQE